MRFLLPLFTCLMLSSCAPECPPSEPLKTAVPVSDFSQFGLTSFQGNLLESVKQPLFLPTLSTLPSGFLVTRVALSEYKEGPGSGPAIDISYFKAPQNEFQILCMSSGIGSLQAPEDLSKIKKVIVPQVGSFEILPVNDGISVWLDEGKPPERMACSLTTQSLSVLEVVQLLKGLKRI